MTIKFKSLIVALFALGAVGCSFHSSIDTDAALYSINVGKTITKVRVATLDNKEYVVATAYDGELLGIAYDGTIEWRMMPNEGIMNHDICCYDLDGDGSDEVLAASGDGSLYCVNHKGVQLWSFKPSSAPMYSVAVAAKAQTPVIACGGYDLNLYYLDADGNKLAAIPSASYSVEKPFKIDDNKEIPSASLHSPNFIRTTKDADGNDLFILHGISHSMNVVGSKGNLYWFRPLENTPCRIHRMESPGAFGSFSYDLDGNYLMGSSKMLGNSGFVKVDFITGKEQYTQIAPLFNGDIDSFGYRVAQIEEIPTATGDSQYLLLYGSRIVLADSSLSPENTQVLTSRCSFNDMCKDATNHKLVLASAQSGGSCIHVIGYTDTDWKEAYESLLPIGNIEAILAGTKQANAQLDTFVKPANQYASQPIYFMGGGNGVKAIADDIRKNYTSPIFLKGVWSDGAEDWDRSGIAEKRYREKRDARRKYNRTQQEVLDQLLPALDKGAGISYWGGHGNDPYMVNPATNRKIIDAANGKKVVLSYPELEEHNPEFRYVLDDMLYPLASYCRAKNANIYVRSKNIFWHSLAYTSMWERLMSGEFADVFVPAMEETTDKTMELSLVARLGVWASGATDSWGSRCARDNASFDRLRQFSHQMIPNHFLRMMIYHASMGSQYIENTWVDEEYMSIFSRMIAKELIFVPKREDIVSFSPVHLSMLEPDYAYMDRGSNVKWTTFYTPEIDEKETFVFGRLDGSYPGAEVTKWDFSRYAAGVKDRRLNFLPPYNNGLVLITPPQDGVFADKDAPRGALVDHLNPIYKEIMKEYYTDGRYYYSKDGKTKYRAEEYYKVVEQDIKECAKLLPLTLEGKVAWVAAESAPNHIRLTLVDGGYINPSNKEVVVHFNTITPTKVVDLLTGEVLSVNEARLNTTVDCGMFRFLDIAY